MRLTRSGDIIEIVARRYGLKILLDERIAVLSLPGKRFSYTLSLLTACNQPGRTDWTEGRLRVKLRERNKSGVEISMSDTSSLWEYKACQLILREESIQFECSVQGSGPVERVHFFRGFREKKEYGCAPGFDRVFTAAPNFHEKNYFHPADTVAIDAAIKPFAGGTCLASPYYFFGLNDSSENAWVGVGPMARPGENLFEAFEMNPRHAIEQTAWAPDNMLGGGFSLVYNGNFRVKGDYTFPALLFTFGQSEWEALERHCGFQRRLGLLPALRRKAPPASWLEPIFCGWHEQGVMVDFGASRDDQVGSVFSQCTQKNYERWLALLEREGCKPGTIIVDAKWQIDTGNNVADPRQFPDLRGFIDRCHARRQRILLWFALWSAEGVPATECILCDGKPVGVDPTNGAYAKRLRSFLRRMISSEPGCYNADGVKIDGMLSVPIGSGLKVKGRERGLELQKLILSIIYNEVKRHKPDTIVSVCSAHPYLLDVIDMVRIGDMYTVKASCEDTMRHRAGIYKTLMPGVPIDTDGQFSHNLAENWREIFKTQAEIGIPTLYAARHAKRGRFFMDSKTNKFTADDYRYFSQILHGYRKKLSSANYNQVSTLF